MSTESPKGKTIDGFFADSVSYLFQSKKELFKGSDSNGDVRRDSVSNDIELVLTYSDGRGGSQKTKLRTAAVKTEPLRAEEP